MFEIIKETETNISSSFLVTIYSVPIVKLYL